MYYGPIPNIDDCDYDEELGMYYDSDSGNYYTCEEDGKIYEGGSDYPINYLVLLSSSIHPC